MKTLLIDLGNSALKWRFQDANLSIRSGRIEYTQQSIASDLVTGMRDLSAPDRIMVASVVTKEISRILDRFLLDKWQLGGEYFQTGSHSFGITNGYQKPETLGCDRWAAMIAAYQAQKRSVLVVDCGTAMTLDGIDDEGHHIGGAIAAGLNTGIAALTQRTTLEVGSRHMQGKQNLFATSTVQGVQAGALFGAVALIEYAADEMVALGHEPILYITGGDARLIIQRLDREHVYAPDLVLDGLALVLEQA